MERCLARYDLRTKQNYIYRTNKIQEIAGASALMTAIYDLFISELENTDGMKIERNYEAANGRYINSSEPFTADMEALDGKVVYIGGGCLYMLWKSEAVALKASGTLCRMLREKTYGLSPVCGIVPYTGAYASDIAQLNSVFEKCKAQQPYMQPFAMLPFTEVDRKTSLPIAVKTKIGDTPISLSQESALKRDYTAPVIDGLEQLCARDLDEMCTEKNTESLLAVIYIDGNNIGERVHKTMCPEDQAIDDYTQAVRVIRALSNAIQEEYVTRPVAAIAEMLANKGQKARLVVSGGDEITIICNARVAMDVVCTHFKTLCSKPENTACAGICVFHSHFPFATAYRIAEECCENAKKCNRRNGGNNNLLDFELCYGGVNDSLKGMRDAFHARYIQRPYCYSGQSTLNQLATFRRCAKSLSVIERSHIKELNQKRMEGENGYLLELDRLKTRYPNVMNDKETEKYLYDIAVTYDVWNEWFNAEEV